MNKQLKLPQRLSAIGIAFICLFHGSESWGRTTISEDSIMQLTMRGGYETVQISDLNFQGGGVELDVSRMLLDDLALVVGGQVSPTSGGDFLMMGFMGGLKKYLWLGQQDASLSGDRFSLKLKSRFKHHVSVTFEQRSVLIESINTSFMGGGIAYGMDIMLGRLFGIRSWDNLAFTFLGRYTMYSEKDEWTFSTVGGFAGLGWQI